MNDYYVDRARDMDVDDVASLLEEVDELRADSPNWDRAVATNEELRKEVDRLKKQLIQSEYDSARLRAALVVAIECDHKGLDEYGYVPGHVIVNIERIRDELLGSQVDPELIRRYTLELHGPKTKRQQELLDRLLDIVSRQDKS